MTDLEKAAKEFKIKEIIITMILSSFGFLLALQWRAVIKDTIDTIIPQGEGLLYEYMVAILLTIIVVIVTYILVRIKRTELIPDKYEPQKILVKEIKKLKKKKK